MRLLKFHEAILEATDQLMELDARIYIMGLGVPDPKGIFATTIGLQEKYGIERVMDMPTSENAMTGIAIGSAICGMRPIMTHQRVDFMLLALDQLINNAAKWNFMFADQMNVPLVIRLIIGRGWGQGPQHSQTFQTLFSHVPGLKVLMPSTPHDAKGLLIAAVEDDGPVIFMEHRWLHHISGHVPQAIYKVPIGKAHILKEGTDLTIVAASHMSLEAWKAAHMLQKEGVSVEIVDLRTLSPLDTDTVFESVKKTGRLIALDADWKTGGFAAEIVALVSETLFECLKAPPKRLTYPDEHCPTTWALANFFFPTIKDIAALAFQTMEKYEIAERFRQESLEEKKRSPLDVPDPLFTGPF